MDVMAIQSKRQRQRMLMIYSSLTLIVMILEIIFRDYLFLTLSRQIITSLQSTFSDPAFPYFFRFMSFFGTPSLLVPLFLIIFAAEIKKFLAIKLTLYICFVGYVVSVMKAIYGSPRPYWIYPNDPSLPGYSEPGIIPYEHYAEYGNPSGHSFLVTSFYGYLYYVFLYKIPKKTPGIGAEENAITSEHRRSFTGLQKEETELQESQKMVPEGHHHSHMSLEIKLPERHSQEEVKQSPLYPLAKALYFTLMFLIAVSRMYLGMHALNQVLLGLTLGAYSLFLIIYYIDPLLDDFLKKVKARGIRNRGTVLTMFFIAYVILTTIPILLFYRNEEDPGVAWTEWWVVVSKEVNPPKFTFAYIKCFLDCGVLGVGFGAISAMMTLENNYLDKGLKFSALTRTALALRIVVFVLTAGVAGGIFLIIPTPEDGWVLRYLINANFAALAATYSAINFAPLVYGKIGLEADKYFHHPRELHVDYSFSL